MPGRKSMMVSSQQEGPKNSASGARKTLKSRASDMLTGNKTHYYDRAIRSEDMLDFFNKVKIHGEQYVGKDGYLKDRDHMYYTKGDGYPKELYKVITVQNIKTEEDQKWQLTQQMIADQHIKPPQDWKSIEMGAYIIVWKVGMIEQVSGGFKFTETQPKEILRIPIKDKTKYFEIRDKVIPILNEEDTKQKYNAEQLSERLDQLLNQHYPKDNGGLQENKFYNFQKEYNPFVGGKRKTRKNKKRLRKNTRKPRKSKKSRKSYKKRR
jgi:hypothetical protein